MSPPRASTGISLPSIQELFPDYELLTAAKPSSHSHSTRPRSHTVASRACEMDRTRAPDYHRRSSSDAHTFLRHDASRSPAREICDVSVHQVEYSRPGVKMSPRSVKRSPEMPHHIPTTSHIRCPPVCSCPSCCDPRLSPGYSVSSSHAPSSPGSARRRVENEKKHACPWCSKRFDRPSSLAIHINTHTGEKPYACAFPGCGRKFNVNSNMRRHYRNHCASSNRLSVLPPLRDVFTMSDDGPTYYLSSPATPGPTPGNSPYSADSNIYPYYGDSDSDDFSDYGAGEEIHPRYEAVVAETTSLANMKLAAYPDAMRASPRVMSHADSQARRYSDSRDAYATENGRSGRS